MRLALSSDASCSDASCSDASSDKGDMQDASPLEAFASLSLSQKSADEKSLLSLLRERYAQNVVSRMSNLGRMTMAEVAHGDVLLLDHVLETIQHDEYGNQRYRRCSSNVEDLTHRQWVQAFVETRNRDWGLPINTWQAVAYFADAIERINFNLDQPRFPADGPWLSEVARLQLPSALPVGVDLADLGVRRPHPDCDVLFCHEALSADDRVVIRSTLDDLASASADYPHAKYQNVLDANLHGVRLKVDAVSRFKDREDCPNKCVSGRLVPVMTHGCDSGSRYCDECGTQWEPSELGIGLPWVPSDYRWVPTEVRVSADASCRLLGPLFDLPQSAEFAPFYAAVERLCARAAPMLAALRRPAFLLPGTLQMVPKAQRILLEGGESYEGVWHQDGRHDAVQAVVLYYYRVDEALRGGAVELADKGAHDCGFGQPGDVLNIGRDGCTVDVDEGLLLVFSNMQLVHRVLTLTNTGTSCGSRDFLAFFVLDQREPVLPSSYVFQSAMPSQIAAAGHILDLACERHCSGQRLPADIIERIFRFASAVCQPPAREAAALRQRLHDDQMQAKRLGNWVIYACGNGDCHEVCWGGVTSLDEDGCIGSHGSDYIVPPAERGSRARSLLVSWTTTPRRGIRDTRTSLRTLGGRDRDNRYETLARDDTVRDGPQAPRELFQRSSNHSYHTTGCHPISHITPLSLFSTHAIHDPFFPFGDVDTLSISPQPAMTTGSDVRPVPEPTASIALTTVSPLTTLPKTTCLPSRCVQTDVVRKNCDPFVSGPALAIDSRKGTLCETKPFSNSSANFSP